MKKIIFVHIRLSDNAQQQAFAGIFGQDSDVGFFELQVQIPVLLASELSLPEAAAAEFASHLQLRHVFFGESEIDFFDLQIGRSPLTESLLQQRSAGGPSELRLLIGAALSRALGIPMHPIQGRGQELLPALHDLGSDNAAALFEVVSALEARDIMASAAAPGQPRSGNRRSI